MCVCVCVCVCVVCVCVCVICRVLHIFKEAFSVLSVCWMSGCGSGCGSDCGCEHVQGKVCA